MATGIKLTYKDKNGNATSSKVIKDLTPEETKITNASMTTAAKIKSSNSSSGGSSNKPSSASLPTTTLPSAPTINSTSTDSVSGGNLGGGLTTNNNPLTRNLLTNPIEKPVPNMSMATPETGGIKQIPLTLQEKMKQDLPNMKNGIGFSTDQLSPLNVIGMGGTLGGTLVQEGEKVAAQTLSENLAKKGAQMAAGEYIPNAAAKAAAGNWGTNTAGKIATNTATAKTTMSWLTKLASAAKNPYVVLGAIGTYAFSTSMAFNEKNDALQNLGMAVTAAEKRGDIQEAMRLNQDIQDIKSLTSTLMNFAPVINYPIAAITKMSTIGDTSAQSVIRMQEDKDQQNLDQQKQIASDKAYADKQAQTKIDKEAQQKADAEYYQGIADKQAKAKEDGRIADEKYYKQLQDEQDKRAAKQQADKIAEEKRQDERYRKIQAEQDARDEADRLAKIAEEERTAAYWAKVAKQKAAADTTKSKLGFGII